MIISVIERALEKKYAFFGVFFLVFLFSYLVLVAIDFVPEPKIENTEQTNAEMAVVEVQQSLEEQFLLPMSDVSNPVFPTSIYIEKLDRTVPILNPESREVADLDRALLEGVVRHPDSANMAQDGNVFVLGHSSHLPTVVNKNFQAFNGIEDLAWGDKIEVKTGEYAMVYEVEKVYKASASDLTVPVSGTGPRLTLATCNSFGSKDDRFIVEAKRVEVKTL